MKGSFTIEAAFIFPFCILVIGCICSLGIYKYNLAVLEMSGYQCILQSVQEQSAGEEQFLEELEALLLQNGKQRGLLVEDLTVEVKKTVTKIMATYCGTQSILNVPLEVTVVYERVYPELTVRLI